MFDNNEERYQYLKDIGKDGWYHDDMKFMDEYIKNKDSEIEYSEWRKPTSRNDWTSYPTEKPAKKEFAAKYMSKIKELPASDYVNTDWWRYIQNWMRYYSNRKCGSCGKEHCTLTLYCKNWENKGGEKFKDLEILCNNCANKIYFVENYTNA